MRKLLRTSAVIGALVCSISVLLAPVARASGPIVLKAVTFVPLNVIDTKGLFMLADIVKKNSNGALTIHLIGGPEAIPPFDQFEATRKGVVDMMMAPESYYAATVSNVPYTHLSKFTPQEERENGCFRNRRELLEKNNIYYLGKGQAALAFNFWIKSRIDKPQGMAGKKIRVSPFYVPFMKALGASPVVLPPQEIYTALERGVVDGYGWPVSGVIDHRWQEVCKYVIRPGVWQASLEILMNLNTHKKLPANLQKVLEDSMIEAEKGIYNFWLENAQGEWKKVLEQGVTPIDFSPKDTKDYVDLAYSSSWADVMKNIKPQELGPVVQKLYMK